MDTTPVVLLTGFLGSGKTTLLNRWLARHHDLAVIINELGEVGIDQHLVSTAGTPVTLLAGGCICCTVRGTLSSTLRNLFMARAAGDVPPFRRVVVETTGAADPFGVIGVLDQDAWLRKRFYLQSVVTSVDAVAGAAALKRHPQVLEQITAADLLLLTKIDLATAAQRRELEAALAALNPGAQCWSAADDRDALVPSFPRRCRIIGTLTPLAGPAVGTPAADHGLYPAAVRISGPRAYAHWHRALGDLLEACGENLVRLKGLLAVENLDGPLLVQGVNAEPLEMTPLPVWPDEQRDSRLVLICDGDAGFPAERLQAFRQALD